jgi:hypothetical protein
MGSENRLAFIDLRSHVSQHTLRSHVGVGFRAISNLWIAFQETVSRPLFTAHNEFITVYNFSFDMKKAPEGA